MKGKLFVMLMLLADYPDIEQIKAEPIEDRDGKNENGVCVKTFKTRLCPCECSLASNGMF